MASRGRILRAVETLCTHPALRTPMTLMATTSHTVATAVAAAANGERRSAGKNGVRYPTNATASAPRPTQIAIQYPHAIRKPANSPNARRVYAYAPPGDAPSRASLANTRARHTDPPAEMSQ